LGNIDIIIIIIICLIMMGIIFADNFVININIAIQFSRFYFHL
jgi:hypothetical protein